MKVKTLIQGIVAACTINGLMVVVSVPAFSLPHPPTQIIAQNSTQLSEKNIKELLAALKTAQQNKDVEGMVKYFAPFIVSTMEVKIDEGDISVTLQGKGEHRDFLTQTYARIKKSETLTQDTTLEISEDGELAIAKVSSVANLTNQEGKQFLSSSNYTIRFAVVDNQLMIVSMTSEGWISERPSSNGQ